MTYSLRRPFGCTALTVDVACCSDHGVAMICCHDTILVQSQLECNNPHHGWMETMTIRIFTLHSGQGWSFIRWLLLRVSLAWQ